MYTKDMYENEILRFLEDRQYDPVIVARKTFQIFIDNQRTLDKNLYQKLTAIFAMEEGPEFEMTEKEFRDFLNKM